MLEVNDITDPARMQVKRITPKNPRVLERYRPSAAIAHIVKSPRINPRIPKTQKIRSFI